MAKQDDGLFLLEVLIDKIVFVKSPCFTDKDFRTCVNIECPAVEPLEICDDDPGACFAKSGGPFVKTFNNGKSCLFSLKEADIAKAMSKFPIKVSVYKSLPCGCLPTKIVMGEATIDMTKEFVQARKKFLEDPTSVSYQALKDSFRIVGPDGAESGEIVMFLRISCFGKLIITRFQGGGPPTLGGSAGPAIVDRSCTPRRDFQTTSDPCACGAARGVPGGSGGAEGAGGGGAGGQICPGGGGGGVCPPAKDPYNSMPCIDGDDVCYCSGPKPEAKSPMACRNIDQYCLHVPKGVLPSLPLYQELTEEQKVEIRISNVISKGYMDKYNMKITALDVNPYVKTPILDNISQYFDTLRGITTSIRYMYGSFHSTVDSSVGYINTIEAEEQSLLHKDADWMYMFDQMTYRAEKDDSKHNLFIENDKFGQKEIAVYMTYLDDFRHRTSGTQATASINKCLQVGINASANRSSYCPSSCGTILDAPSACSMSTTTYRGHESHVPDRLRYSDVYYFGKKKNEDRPKGMGSSEPTTYKKGITTVNVTHKSRGGSSTTAQTQSKGTVCCGAQTKPVSGSCASTCTGKAVCIKDDKSDKPCPATAAVKGDMMATISHIRIGPKEPCPVHGPSPCQGPKCILAASGEDQAPVKVSTVTNPRRGVFELVIRRMTGAPLAKNELMLEWTPPPSRPPCGSPCGAPPCSPPGPCRPSKCKMIVCRASPCKPKICKKGCKRPCRPVPCRPVPCKKCKKCPPSPCKPCPPPSCGGCGSGCCSLCPGTWPCRPLPPWRFKACGSSCKPCPPSSCRSCGSCKPCPPRPCPRPCGPPPSCVPCKPCPVPRLKSACPTPCCKTACCATPCRSTPCLHPCRRKRPRKSRSSPKIKARRKRISPCCNRTKQCPVVRCRSLPGPCVICCSFPRCPPRKCCSGAPCKPPSCG